MAQGSSRATSGEGRRSSKPAPVSSRRAMSRRISTPAARPSRARRPRRSPPCRSRADGRRRGTARSAGARPPPPERGRHAQGQRARPSAVATATPTSDDPATAPTIRDPFRAAATSRDRADVTSNGLTTRAASVERRQLVGAQRGDHRRLGTDGLGRGRPRRRRRRTTSRGPRPRRSSRGSATARTRASISSDCRVRGRLLVADRLAGVRRVVEGRRHPRRPERRRLGLPAVPPRGRRLGRRLAVRPGQPRQRPRPRHHPVGVVPAAARREPSAARPPVRDRVDQPRRLPHRRRRHPQVGERVPRVRVGPVLRDDDVRPERRGERRQQGPDRGQPRRLPGVRLERHVDRRPGRGALPQLVDEPGPREQVPPALVERHRQHARVVVRDRLDAVAVVHVEVDVQDAQAGGRARTTASAGSL